MSIKSVMLLFAVPFSMQAFAQQTGAKNMGKINLSALAVKSIGVQYERQVSPHITVALGYSNIPKSSLAFKSTIENIVDDPSANVGAFKLGTSIFTPEVRYYVSKKGAFHGFYLAPYARFGAYNLEGPIDYTSSTNVTRNAYFTGKLNAVTGGLMIGSNFKLSEKWYLDWWIVGASFGGANGDFVATTALSPDEQIALKRELDELDIPFTTLESRVNSNGATVTTSGNMAGVRGLGINISFRF